MSWARFFKGGLLFRGLFRNPRRWVIGLFGLVGLLMPPNFIVHASPPAVPAELSSEYDWIEAEYQNILKRPIASWKLREVRERFQALLKKAKDAKAQALIQARVDRILRQEDMARSAATFESILEKSRSRDREVILALQNLAAINRPRSRPFTARGLLQASSRQVNGHRVYALIGDEGRPIAYLDVPAGLDARPIVSKRVGVRGSVRYNEGLGTKLIAVRDFETLE